MPALTKSESALKKQDVYEEFVLWFALPRLEKIKLGIETQGDFCEHNKIGINTPTHWKTLPDFQARVRDLRQKWGGERTSDVLQGIYLAAMKGNPMSQLLWLQFFEGFAPKSGIEHTEKVELSVHDIRFIIDQLPEPIRSQNYERLTAIIADATAFEHARRNAREGEISAGRDESAGSVHNQTDHVAPDVPDEKPTHAVAEGNPRRIRNDVVAEVHTRDHKGTARRWEE